MAVVDKSAVRTSDMTLAVTQQSGDRPLRAAGPAWCQCPREGWTPTAGVLPPRKQSPGRVPRLWGSFVMSSRKGGCESYCPEVTLSALLSHQGDPTTGRGRKCRKVCVLGASHTWPRAHHTSEGGLMASFRGWEIPLQLSGAPRWPSELQALALFPCHPVGTC